MNFTASWRQSRRAFSVGVLDQPPSAPPSAPPPPAPASAPPSAKSVASPSTDVAATIRDVLVSITRMSMAMCAFLSPPAMPPRTRPGRPADAAEAAADAGGGALELGDGAGDQELRALDLADRRLGPLLDPAGRAEVLLAQNVAHLLALEDDVAVRVEQGRRQHVRHAVADRPGPPALARLVLELRDGDAGLGPVVRLLLRLLDRLAVRAGDLRLRAEELRLGQPEPPRQRRHRHEHRKHTLPRPHDPASWRVVPRPAGQGSRPMCAGTIRTGDAVRPHQALQRPRNLDVEPDAIRSVLASQHPPARVHAARARPRARRAPGGAGTSASRGARRRSGPEGRRAPRRSGPTPRRRPRPGSRASARSARPGGRACSSPSAPADPRARAPRARDTRPTCAPARGDGSRPPRGGAAARPPAPPASP